MPRSNSHGLRPEGRRSKGQSGFTIIEMLMTAFILSVGILGLSMLQVMSLKVSRGGRSLTSAVQVADHVLDQVEMEGRLTWLDLTDSQYTIPSTFTTLRYVRQAAPVLDTFDINGGIPAAPAAVFYNVSTQRTDLPQPNAVTGQVHDFTVTVTFSDTTNPTTHLPINRTVSVTRRIVHG